MRLKNSMIILSFLYFSLAVLLVEKLYLEYYSTSINVSAYIFYAEYCTYHQKKKKKFISKCKIIR